MHRRMSIGLVCTSLLGLPACDDAPVDSPHAEMQQRLAGTWLRDYVQDGVRVRRILVLEPYGGFQEKVRITDAGGAVTEQTHAGTWFFDGTNLKRKYTSMDGKQPSAPTVPFATFQIKLPSKNEFVGIDNVHKREVRYQRVEAGTLP